MNKNELKKIMKPLIKECIHEVLLEDGLLSNVVSEVAKGMQGNLVVETQRVSPTRAFDNEIQTKKKISDTKAKMGAHRKKLMESIGSDAYNGVNLFEGTEPMKESAAGAPRPGTVDLGSSEDAGVDISSLMGGASKIWQAMK